MRPKRVRVLVKLLSLDSDEFPPSGILPHCIVSDFQPALKASQAHPCCHLWLTEPECQQYQKEPCILHSIALFFSLGSLWPRC